MTAHSENVNLNININVKREIKDRGREIEPTENLNVQEAFSCLPAKIASIHGLVIITV